MTAEDWRAERDRLRRQTVVAHHPPHIDWLDAKSIICTRKCKAHGSALKLSQTRHSTESPRPTKLIIILSDPAATLSHYRIQSTRHCQITDPQTPSASPYHHTTTRVVIHYDSNYLLTMHLQLHSYSQRPGRSILHWSKNGFCSLIVLVLYLLLRLQLNSVLIMLSTNGLYGSSLHETLTEYVPRHL